MKFDIITGELGALTTLSPNQLLALTVFASYFGLIGWLFTKVLVSIHDVALGAPQPATKRGSRNGRPRKLKDGSRRGGGFVHVFQVLTLASFAHTWFYMFKYMAGSFQSYEISHSASASASAPFTIRLSSWLRDTSLFEEAWYAVCEGKLNWLWSEQLCLFTVGVWTVMLWVEGTRHGIKHIWAYMVLGQVVAISVASNLFYLAVLSTPRIPSRSTSALPASTSTAPSKNPKVVVRRANEPVRVPPAVYVPVLLSLATVAASPHTSLKTFLPNLLVMHVLIVIPLIPRFTRRFPSPTSAKSISLSTVYYAIFLLTIPIRYRTLVAASDAEVTRPLWAPEPPYGGVLSWFERQWFVLFESPAQSSIGWDVVWTTVSFVVWVLVTGGSVSGEAESSVEAEEVGVWGRLWRVVYLVFATPLASVGVTGAYVLSPRVGGEEDEDGKKEE